MKHFRDQHADGHVVAQAGAEHDTENDNDIEHRQAVNETESKKTEGAHDETDEEHSLGTNAVGQVTFYRTQNPGLDARQRERTRDCGPAPAELPLEGREERAHAKVAEAGIDCVGNTTGDHEPPFSFHQMQISELVASCSTLGKCVQINRNSARRKGIYSISKSSRLF